MTDGGFDVLVIAFAPRAHETAGSALSRVVGMEASRAEALCRALPCVVLSDVAYAQAESVAASLSLAGAEASVRPHANAAPPLEEAGRMTMPEVAGADAVRPPRALGAARAGSTHPAPAPSTLRPPNVSDAEPAMVFESLARVALPAPDDGPVEGPVRPGMDTVRQVPSLPEAAPPAIALSETVAAPPLQAARAASAVGQSWNLDLDLDLAPKRSPAAVPQGFAADFGKGLELELAAVTPARPVQRRRPPSEPPEEPAPPAQPPRISLDIQLSFPREPASGLALAPPPALDVPTEHPVPRAALPAASPASSVSPSAAPVARRAPVPRPMLEADGTITRRTLYLLAMLWVSVGLLLWTHDLF